MVESGKTDFIYKKSYEISYALWQVASHIKEKNLADRLFDKAIELIGYAANDDHRGMANAAEGLQMLIKFAVDVNCISISNAVILAREIGSLQSAIRQPIESMRGDGDIDISDIFSTQPVSEEEASELLAQDVDVAEETRIENLPEIEESGNFAAMDNGNENVQEGSQEIGNKAAMRQAAILQRIRQSGNCRLGDIQAILPDSSERTIRYDLESLVGKGLIERMGIGGRSVHYRAK